MVLGVYIAVKLSNNRCRWSSHTDWGIPPHVNGILSLLVMSSPLDPFLDFLKVATWLGWSCYRVPFPVQQI